MKIFLFLPFKMMDFNTKPLLEDNTVLLTPLLPEHFNLLYEVARDPILWEHHPMSKRYEKEVFKDFFKIAISVGSLLIVDKLKQKVIGCTRFYDYNKEDFSVVIGHTFIAKDYWGTGYNARVKDLMFNYAFRFAQRILFYVVTENVRSRKALEKLGAKPGQEIKREYDGRTLACIVYELARNDKK
ncbi:MAG: GNAT family N-acetyltransferase [Bacteroidia bacterium]